MISPVHVARISWSNVDHLRNRFSNATLASLTRDVTRAARLLRTDPAPRMVPARAERVVVTLSTVPRRRRHLRPVLRSLLDQTVPADRLLLAWPRHSLRSGVAYPDPPSLPAEVDIVQCEDEGPATKLLPALRAEPNAVLVVVDDDAIYPQTFLEDLLAAHRQDPAAALGLRGQYVRFGCDPRYLGHVYGTAVLEHVPVDVLMGMWGYLIPPGSLDEAVHDFEGWPDEVRWQDDVWISAHLARRRVSRLVVPVSGTPLESTGAFVGALHHTVNRSGHNEAVAFETFKTWW
ncbi:hypothetical protein [Nocardia vaccinii]|uniref:hypothetical protein n=1 Tax=Nocardia vaccinii TaxID=1822 RepID=UPI0008323643|nr:hypothetical protein [Nocardia vaccinii]